MSHIISQSYLHAYSLWTQQAYTYPLLVIHIPEYNRYVISHQGVIAMSHSLRCVRHVTSKSMIAMSYPVRA